MVQRVQTRRERDERFIQGDGDVKDQQKRRAVENGG